ncbi:phage tail sheath subtilisin-like domain-containing protein [Methanobrevibacter arboriphilus]|uniref:phage tail sheath subtilisin-like domain-containing protein n=1 Tax=Methanobrevibacter arboriphilus TaxID=39441 RepID=UPI000A72ED25|nr:phage tail sheath subtilisin-like domain-containing protein [Methanobrevibacter arboriphilus]
MNFWKIKKAKNNRSISLDSITPSDTNDSKIGTVETARSTDSFYINQNIQVSDEELSQSDSIARIAGIIAGTKVNQSLSKQTITDIQKVDPVLTDKEVDELTDKGIICLELINRENNEYGIYSAVSSCIETDSNGKKST